MTIARHILRLSQSYFLKHSSRSLVTWVFFGKKKCVQLSYCFMSSVNVRTNLLLGLCIYHWGLVGNTLA